MLYFKYIQSGRLQSTAHESAVEDVVRDTPEFYEFSSEAQDILITAIRKAIEVGARMHENTEPQATAPIRTSIVDEAMSEMGISPSSAYVTHHDVRRVAQKTFELTEAVLAYNNAKLDELDQYA